MMELSLSPLAYNPATECLTKLLSVGNSVSRHAARRATTREKSAEIAVFLDKQKGCWIPASILYNVKTGRAGYGFITGSDTGYFTKLFQLHQP